MLSKSELVTLLLFKTNTKANFICEKISMTPQSFSRKLKNGTLSEEEVAKIAASVCAKYQQIITLNSGEVIGY